MTTAGELLDNEEKGWLELRARLDRLDEGDWVRPGVNGDWTAKDVLAHVAAWHTWAAERLERANAGEYESKRWSQEQVDAFNAEAFGHHRSMPLDDVRMFSDEARATFCEQISLLEDETAEKVRRLVFGNAEDHYDEHIKQFDAFLGAK
jgi:hypothetical protein